MSPNGLQVVPNPSEIFLSEQNSDSDILAGLAVTVIMDGSRSFILEIQVVLLFPLPLPPCTNGQCQLNKSNEVVF